MSHTQIQTFLTSAQERIVMLSIDGEYIVCGEPNCDNHIKNHLWGRIKAEGWFFTRTRDEAWCPDHLPEWVIEWRGKKEKE